MKISCLLISALAAADAFTSPMTVSKAMSTGSVNLLMAQENEEGPSSELTVPAFTAAIWAMTSTSAMAAGPDWGIFEGKTGSILHPIMMASLLGLSVSTALLGFDWRRQRTIGDEISSLKKSIPSLGESSSVSEALAAAKSAESVDFALVSKLEGAVPVEAQVKELQNERKGLAEKGPRDQHFSQGATLAFLGTVFAIEVRRS